MKKILIATTALVATAGVASADMTWSGYGRLGVQYTEGTAAVTATGSTAAQRTAFTDALADVATADAALTAAVGADAIAAAAADLIAAEAAALAAGAAVLAANTDTPATNDATVIDQRLRLNFRGTAETDAGLALGASMRLQWDDAGDSQDPVGATAMGARAASFDVSWGSLRLDLGNVSVAEATPGFYDFGIGYTGAIGIDPWTVGYGDHDIGFTTGGTNGVAMLTFSNAGLTARVSHSEDDTTGEERNTMMAAYSMGDYTVSVFKQDSTDDSDDVTKFYASASMGAHNLGFFADDSDAGNAYGLGYSTEIAPGLSATLVAQRLADDNNQYGVGLNGSLGAGVSWGAGIVSNDGQNYAEAGMVFNF
jgi:outer membrane protein OmpU